ncbi:MAG TPA: hypothetical protein VHY08_16735 [Bacillota bacterium]|nr:hypothetical protein [Bacillota bacterium]
MFKNKLFLGVFAGLTASIVKDAVNQILYSLRIIKILFAQYAVGVFISTMDTKSLLGIVTWYAVDFGLSALLGIIFIFILEKTKPKHIVFQGIVFGSTLYIGIYGALLAMGISSLKDRELMDVVLMIICHLVYGLTLGLFVQKYGRNLLTLSTVKAKNNDKIGT